MDMKGHILYLRYQLSEIVILNKWGYWRAIFGNKMPYLFS